MQIDPIKGEYRHISNLVHGGYQDWRRQRLEEQVISGAAGQANVRPCTGVQRPAHLAISRAYPHLGASYTVKTFVFLRRIGLEWPRRRNQQNNS